MNALKKIVCLWALIVPFILYSQDEYLDESDLFDDLDVYDNLSVRTIADPLEGYNRMMFSINDFFYTTVMGPVARTYGNAMPMPAQKGINSFFYNLRFPVRLVGNLMQFKLKGAGEETGRFLINTTVGIGGFLDPATDIGLNPPVEDIGQALGRWGIGDGFYLVLPFYGPSSGRDVVGLFGDMYVHPIRRPESLISSDLDRYLLFGAEAVNRSPSRYERYDSLTRASIDPYVGMRDGYIQYRQAQVKE